MLNAERVRQVVEWTWEEAALPVLSAYTAIPALSPAYDPTWEHHGHLHQAAEMLWEWAVNRPIEGLHARLHEPPGTTPLLTVEAGGPGPLVVLYGHLDKQPPLGDWAEGLEPFKAVRREDRLYGRGTADDGYALFAALTAMESLTAAGGRLPRCLVVIEASEESGSPDLPSHLEALDLGSPDLVICLDSGALSYDRLWRTTSLRGAIGASLRVDVLREGVHSGLAGAVVPSSFRLLRRLLSRVEDEGTGEVLLPEAHGDPSAARPSASPSVTDGEALPVVDGLRLGGADPADRLRRQAFEPALEVTGLDGAPPVADAGNVLRAYTAAKLSLRVAPSSDAEQAARALGRVLSHDPPEGAKVSVALDEPAQGWVAPPLADWLDQVVDQASRRYFGAPAAGYGVGGTIPFLPMLQQRFPTAQFLATGVLGPKSNAHGPNEFLHLPTARSLTCCVAEVLAAITE